MPEMLLLAKRKSSHGALDCGWGFGFFGGLAGLAMLIAAITSAFDPYQTSWVLWTIGVVGAFLTGIGAYSVYRLTRN